MAEKTKSTPNLLLRRERERRCWSQQELADMVGTTPLNVGRWERGVTQPGPHFRQKLCELFERTPQQLGFFSEQAENISGTIAATTSANAPNSPSNIASDTSVPAEVWNVPYRRNPFFTGRDKILMQMCEAFTANEQPVALAQPQAISGLGGIGKTQTAIEYAYRYRESYSTILWARAESADLLTSDYLTIATLLHLPERDEQEQDKVIKALVRWLDTHGGWLLILDNADDIDLASEFLPSAGKGHVLLTTRAFSTGTTAERIELETMEQDEGTLFLLRRIKRLRGVTTLEAIPQTTREQAQAIVDAVDGLPLALDQAGAYIEETGCSLTDYLKFYKTRRNRLLRTRGKDASGHPEPVAATWSLSFERVEQANPSAAELLKLCTFLSPDEIPESMLIAGASELGPLLQPILEDEFNLNDAIRELHRYSLIKRNPEEKYINIHRMVQAVVRDRMEKEEEKAWAERVVRMVNTAFPNPEQALNWSVCQSYLPHAQMCTKLIEQWHMTFDMATQLVHHTGEFLAAHGQYEEAERLLSRALVGLEQKQAGESILAAEVLTSLGLVYWMQGNYEQAASLNQQSLAIKERTWGANDPRLAETLTNLGVIFNAQGKHFESAALNERAVAIYDSDDLNITVAMSNLAAVYDDLGRYAESEQFYKSAIETLERLGGSEHPELATFYNNLAVLYSSLERYEEASPLLEQSIFIVDKTLGPEHPRHGTGLNNLGFNYSNRGMYEEAEVAFKKALAFRQKILRTEHPEIAYSLFGLARTYRLQGKLDLAEPVIQQALDIRLKALGQDHPNVADTFLEQAHLFVDRGNYAEAEQLFQRALTIRENKLGADHPAVAKALASYAELLRKTDREAEAIVLENRANAIRGVIN